MRLRATSTVHPGLRRSCSHQCFFPRASWPNRLHMHHCAVSLFVYFAISILSSPDRATPSEGSRQLAMSVSQMCVGFVDSLGCWLRR